MSELSLLQSISDRLLAIEQHLGISNANAGGANTASPDVPRSIRAFDSYCAERLDPFVASCNKLGGDAALMGEHIKGAWAEMRKFLLMASSCKEPPQSALPGLLGGLAGKLRDIGQTVKRNEWEKHTKTCSEGAQCLNWLCVKPAPRDFIESFIGGSDYWANNIRREFRTTNPDQIAFCDTFKALMLELMTYVKEYHTTGVSWNPRGTDVSAYQFSEPQAVVSAPASSSAPAAKSVAPETAKAAPTVNLFAALNKDSAITSGLKKVTKDQQTWRAEYKADAAAPAPALKPIPAPAKPAAAAVKGPPRNQFDVGAKKWCIEYQTDANGPITVTIGDMKENVYILGCVGATITVVGKCKSIIVDSCKKTKVHFDNVMASCEVVNSQRILIEVREKAPSVAIDKTDGIVVQLPLSSLDTSVVASKSSEMNISWPDANGDLVERPIPEQYVHRITGSSISADVSDLYGH